jgi:hypothetical protein
MKRSVYLETTVIGYIAMRASRDLRVAANQLSTREWWDVHRPNCDVFCPSSSLMSVTKATRNTSQSSNRFLSYRRGRRSWNTIPVNLELQAHCKP